MKLVEIQSVEKTAGLGNALGRAFSVTRPLRIAALGTVGLGALGHNKGWWDLSSLNDKIQQGINSIRNKYSEMLHKPIEGQTIFNKPEKNSPEEIYLTEYVDNLEADDSTMPGTTYLGDTSYYDLAKDDYEKLEGGIEGRSERATQYIKDNPDIFIPAGMTPEQSSIENLKEKIRVYSDPDAPEGALGYSPYGGDDNMYLNENYINSLSEDEIDEKIEELGEHEGGHVKDKRGLRSNPELKREVDLASIWSNLLGRGNPSERSELYDSSPYEEMADKEDFVRWAAREHGLDIQTPEDAEKALELLRQEDSGAFNWIKKNFFPKMFTPDRIELKNRIDREPELFDRIKHELPGVTKSDAFREFLYPGMEVGMG